MSKAGFAAGLLGGIAEGLQERNARKLAQEQRQREQSLQAVQFLLSQGADVADLEPHLALAMPDVFGEAAQKKGKGAPGPQDAIRGMLARSMATDQGPARMATGPFLASPSVSDPTVAADASLPSRQAGPAVPPPVPPPQRTLMGVPILSREQMIARKISEGVQEDEGTINAKVALARRLYQQNPAIPLDDWFDRVGLSRTSRSQQSIPQVGTLGDFMLTKERQLGRQLNVEEKAAARKEWEGLGGNSFKYGVDREAIARAVFGKNYDDLDQASQEIVLREEKTMLAGEAQSRAEGTGQGRMNVPADLRTAQATGVDVGTTAASVAGQNVPTAPDREKRRDVETLKTSLEDIRDRLLTAFPKDADMIGGKLPGAVMMLRRRDPQYRDQIGALESAVNNVVNVVARSVGQQRGAQTENDALRAEAAIASLRDSVLRGDTQESATARINETITILERILAALPATPVPSAAPASTAPVKPAASGTGGAVPNAVMKDGVVYINGVPIQ